MSKYKYSVPYRRDDAPLSRVFHRTVVAASADEARRLVALIDPNYLSTVRSPQRRAIVIEGSK